MTTMIPIKNEDVSASEYLELMDKDSNLIKKAQFVPPKLGESGYGFFRVEYKTQKLKRVDLGTFKP